MFKTQIELARDGILTDIMKAVAAQENLAALLGEWT